MKCVSRLKNSGFLVPGFLLLTLAAAVTLVQQRQEVRKKASEGEYVSILELSAIGQGGNTFTIAPGELFQVELKLIPNQTLSAVDVVLDFDRDLITLENIVPNTDSNLQTFVPLDGSGNFQREAIITEANHEGVIHFGAVTFDYAGEQTTDPQSSPIDPLATLTFRAQATARGTATIEFGTHGFTAEGATTDSNAVKYVASDSGTAVVDILARPTTRIQATVAEAPPPTTTFHLTTGGREHFQSARRVSYHRWKRYLLV